MAGADDLSLSRSYFPLTVTTPAGTTKAAPLSTAVPIVSAVITLVDVLIPAGHKGATGVQLVQSGAVILPFAGTVADQWIVGDDNRIRFDFSYPVSGGLSVRTFNTGQFSHAHYLLFQADYNAYRAAGAGAPVLSLVPVA